MDVLVQTIEGPVVIPEKVVEKMKTITDLLDVNPGGDIIPLAISKSILEYIIKVSLTNSATDIPTSSLPYVIQGCNYLNIEPLIEVLVGEISNRMKECKTPEEIREKFNIANDFTAEEEKEIREENDWQA